jgi:hypothetical protein
MDVKIVETVVKFDTPPPARSVKAWFARDPAF